MSGALKQQDPEFVRGMFAGISARYDLANHVLSMGIDSLWRARAARMIAANSPGKILDMATGSGDLALALQRACPQALVTGADFCLPMLEVARRKGVSTLVQADGLALPFADASFDALTVAFGLRNMASWETALREMARVLRPGGGLLIMDFAMPRAGWLAAAYRFYLHHLLPRLAGWLTGRPEAYEYLGESIEGFPRWEKMCDLISRSGFQDTRSYSLALGIAAIYTGTRKP
ncbi:MAG: bifunctional demethylmenaquinone methyltransferase/2-methoxy-6-polyprenyl-1,4-benzoquinol methylase UbiE [Terrimicrobiaceae bacterium]